MIKRAQQIDSIEAPKRRAILRVVKAQSIRAPLIKSFITKQKNKLKLMPRPANIAKLAALALFCLVVGVPAISAFEAHIVNVTAEVANIDPPVLTPPGSSVAWDNTSGGTGLSGTVKVGMADADTDAVNIYYTFKTGTEDPSLVPDPICGQTGPNGGGGDKNLPQSLSLNSSSVVKAIACDVSNTFHSVINTKIYSFGQPVNNLVINEFLPNPTGTVSGNQGVSGGHTSGKGGEWVELFNNGTTTIDTDGFVLYDGFVPTTTASSFTWTTTNDFNLNPPPVESSTTVSSGSVKLSAGSFSGTFEKVFDTGVNKKASWQDMSMNATLDDAANSVCAAVATSDDGVTYTPYVNLSPCASFASTSVTTSLSPLPNSRFLKWKTTQARGDITKTANLNSLTVDYDFVDYSTYHELVITSGNTFNTTTPGSTVIAPGGFLVVYRDGNPNFDLDSQVNAVSLYDGHLYLGAGLIDSHAYDFGGPIPVNKSFARVPDGSSIWIDPCPTPGEPNVNTECPALNVDLTADNSATTTATTTLDSLPPADGTASSTDVSSTQDIVTPTPTPTPTATPTDASGSGATGVDPTPTPTVVPTDIPTPTDISTPTPTPTPSNTPTLTITPTPTPTPAPTDTPAATTPTPTPTPAPTNTPAAPTPTPVPAPTDSNQQQTPPPSDPAPQTPAPDPAPAS